MRILYYTLLFIVFSQSATAQILSPIQQYLQDETGYAPPDLAPDASVSPEATKSDENTPSYAVAQSHPAPSKDKDNDRQITGGIMGMNM